MKKQFNIVLFVLFLFCGFPTAVRCQVLEWANHAGGNTGDEAKDVAVSTTGEVYTVGYFSGTMQVETASGTQEFTSIGPYDAMLSKSAADGALLWVKTFSGPEQDQAWGVAIDSQDNILITGFYLQSLETDPGSGTFQLNSVNGSKDAFIIKLDSNGEFIWAKSIGGWGDEEGWSIDTDAEDNVIIGGLFWENADFDPGPETYVLNTSGGLDAFVLKLNAAGDFIWANGYGGGSFYTDVVYDLTCDQLGNILAVGPFRGTVDFDLSAGQSLLTAQSNIGNSFMLKLDPIGELIWVKGLLGTGSIFSNEVCTGPQNQIYAGGQFNYHLDADPGVAEQNMTTDASLHGFLISLDASGDFLWGHQLGTVDPNAMGDSQILGVAVNQSGEVFATGSFSQSVDFNPGFAEAIHFAPNQLTDAFLWKLNDQGLFQWVKTFGNSNNERGNKLAIDQEGNILMAGRFAQSVDFGTAQAPYALTSNGGYDMFISKWQDQALPPTGIQSHTSESLFKIYPNPSSGDFNVMIPNQSAIQKIIVFDLHGRQVMEIQKPVNGLWQGFITTPGYYLVQINYQHGKSRLIPFQVE